MTRGSIIVIVIIYLTYLLVATWGTGRLAVNMSDEVQRMSCRPDCKLLKLKNKPPRDFCVQYCEESEFVLD